MVGTVGSGATSGVRLYLVEGRRVRAHPVANTFPLLSDSEIETLAGDIKKYGQQDPVTLQITKSVTVVLDGRNRLLACEHIGIAPKISHFPRDMDPTAYIVSKNLVRRHMTPSQRALVAARMVTVTGRGRPSEIASIEAISQPKAGDYLEVARSQVMTSRSQVMSFRWRRPLRDLFFRYVPSEARSAFTAPGRDADDRHSERRVVAEDSHHG